MRTTRTTSAAELSALRARAATTAERLASAKLAHEQACVRQRQQLASEDFDTGKVAETNSQVWQAGTIVTGLQQLADETEKSIATLEKKLADEKDQAERIAEAAILDQTVEAITGALNDFSASAELLIGTLGGKAVSRTTHEGRNCADGVRNTVGGIIAQVGAVIEGFKLGRSAILEGRSAVPKPPQPAAPTLLIPKVPVMGIFAIKTLKHVRGRETVIIERYQQGELPTELAKFAIDAGYAAVPEKARGFRDLAANTIAGTGVVVDLDAEMAKAKPTMRVPADAREATPQPRATA